MIHPKISLVGGMLIKNAMGKHGTLGLVTRRVKDNKDQLGFLTAGHVFVNPLVEASDTNTVIGMVELNPYKDSASAVDIAFVEIAVGVVYEEGLVRMSPNDAYKITEQINVPLQNQEVIMQGGRSGTQKGVVIYPNVDITFEGVKLHNVCLATYASDPGDSGAPIFYITNQQEKKASLVGIHGGKIQHDGQLHSWFTPLGTIETIIELW